MRYLKKFNESLTHDGIKDFCEMYLAYLLDDGYELAFREIGRITQINFLKPNDMAPIRWSPGQGGQVDWFNWDDIKNSFIPFLKMLDKEYDIKDDPIIFQIPLGKQIPLNFQDVSDDKIKEILIDNRWVGVLRISSIRINVTDHSIQDYTWQIKEAKKDWKRNFPDDELQEVCDRFLPYLYDDGFVVHHSIPTYYMFKKNVISIHKEQEKGDGQGLHIIPFHWYEIADRFLPFFDYLNKYYPLSSIKLVPYRPSWESRWTERGSDKAVVFKADDDKKSWSGHPFSKFEEIMSRDNAYGRPMSIGEIVIEVENLNEVL
jgi:hypothetical protein